VGITGRRVWDELLQVNVVEPSRIDLVGGPGVDTQETTDTVVIVGEE